MCRSALTSAVSTGLRPDVRTDQRTVRPTSEQSNELSGSGLLRRSKGFVLEYRKSSEQAGAAGSISDTTLALKWPFCKSLKIQKVCF